MIKDFKICSSECQVDGSYVMNTLACCDVMGWYYNKRGEFASGSFDKHFKASTGGNSITVKQCGQLVDVIV